VTSRGQDHAATSPGTQHTTKRSQGFLDYALGKVNPDDKDLGAAATTARQGLVRRSIDDLYFWSNLFSLSALVSIGVVFFFQLRSSAKKELICSAIITQLWNARVSDAIEIARRTNQYNHLVETRNAEIELNLLSQSRQQSTDDSPSVKIKRNVEKLEKRKTVTPEPTLPAVAQIPSTLKGLPPAPQQNVLLLEHRLEAMKNTEQNLTERLNQTMFQLEQERQRNSSLKGA
jgi:hypothetical protein